MRSIVVPDDLAELDQWIVWRYEQRPNTPKPTKVPYCGDAHTPASTTDPATWMPYDAALAAWESHPKSINGVGFVFTSGDPYTGIDLDDCLDHGKLKPWARPILESFFDTYMEISPSGCGVKIWAKAKLPGAGRNTKLKDGSIEIYDQGRYFTVTGNVINDAPLQIEDHQSDVEKLYALTGINGHGKPIQGKIPHGTQHNELVRIAGMLRRKGLEFNAIYAALSATNRDQCEIPGPEENIRRIAASACRNWDPDPEADVTRPVAGEPAPSPEGLPDNGATEPVAGAAVPKPKVVPISTPEAYLRNETGNADRLRDRFGTDLMHCEQRDGFMAWNGRAWRFDQFVLSERMAETAVMEMYAEAAEIPDKATRTEYLKFISSSLSRKGLSNMCHLAKKKIRQAASTEFDANPFLLNCANGTIDMKTGDLREHRREDLLSKLIPIDYDEGASCPLFEKFLYRIMGDSENASEESRDTAHGLVSYLQRLFGCAATGKAEKLLVILFGSGNNGKSTLLSTINLALGGHEYATQVNIESLMLDPRGGLSNATNSDLSDLQGCRFVFSSEVDKGQRLAVSRVKYLTGLTSIKTRRLREDWIEFPPTWKIFMDCNDHPVISTPTDAIWNRVKCIPFTVQIPPKEIDTTLPEKLARELPGILNWILAGARDYIEHGIGIDPPSVCASTEEYRATSDRLAPFLEDCCNLNSQSFTSSEHLSGAYSTWCVNNGDRHPLGTQELSAQLRLKGCAPELRKILGRPKRGWLGLELLPTATQEKSNSWHTDN